MNDNKLIQDLLVKLENEFETRKSLFLNIIYRNIDILMLNSQKWFGSDPPEDFAQVIHSLFNLTITYLDETRDYKNLLIDTSYEVFNPEIIMKDISEHVSSMVKFGSFELNSEGNTEINSSLPVFRDSVINIFLAISPYVEADTGCRIDITGNTSQVSIVLSLTDLSPETPDIQKLIKTLYYTSDVYDEMQIRIGLNMAIEGIKKIGGIFNIYAAADNSIDITMTFPSFEFLKNVNDIRKLYLERSLQKKEGIIYISLFDRLTEVLLRDNFFDTGYESKIIKPEHFSKIMPGQIAAIKGIITDLSCFNSPYFVRFSSKYPDLRTVIILKKDENQPETENKNILTVSYPFEIDKLLEMIQ